MKNRLILIAGFVALMLNLGLTRAEVVVIESSDDILISNLGENGEASEAPRKTNTNAINHALPYGDIVRAAALANSIDEAFLHAVIHIESGYNARATSPQGARGLMQLMPATAKELGVSDAYDPSQNIHAGARYLSQLKSQFKDDLSLVLASYNAGPGAVERYGGKIPPYPETRLYVPRVLQIYRRLSGKSV